MPNFESYDPGTPCWVDLSSPDVEASRAFYEAVFGWDGDETRDDDGTLIYTNFTLDGQVVAGVGAQQPEMAGAPPIWSTYVCTDDVAATASKVEAAGGAVMMPPMQVLDVGAMAIFADPSGAVIGAWQPASHKGADVANEPNTWSWNELMSSDLDAVMPFYTEVFGWQYETQDMPDGPYHVIAGGENEGLGGLMAKPSEMPAEVPDSWGVYFTVSDIEATMASITSNGGGVMFGPQSAPGVGTFATVHDPQGGAFNLMQPEAH